MRLKTLDLYIIKKFLGTFFYAIGLIISIAIIFDISEKLDDFMQKKPPLSAIIIDYYLNFIPYWVNQFSYLFIFISVIFFTSRMASNTEIVAILGSGVSFARLMFPYFVSATVLAGFIFLLGNYVIPYSVKVKLKFENLYIKNPYYNDERNIHRQIQPGTFIYMENYNNTSNTGRRFSLERFEDKQLKLKIFGEIIQWDSTQRCWQIQNYYLRIIEKDREIIRRGDKLDTVLNLRTSDFSERNNICETMNLNKLNQFIEEKRLRGERIEEFQMEKYRRLVAPFGAFIMTLLGVTVASRKVRGGIGLHIGIGLTLSFGYLLFLQISRQFAVSGGLHPLLAISIPNVIFAIIGAILYRLAQK